MEWLVALAMILGAAVSSAVMTVLVQLHERRQDMKDSIYYVYQTHLEKNTDRPSRRK